MIKRIYFILFLNSLLLLGCQKKQVQLPLLNIQGMSEIQNHSSIWIFMETKNGESIAKLNKNNKILNTHWIFNIDKRLTMDQVVPLLIEMQKAKNKDSMHKKEGMKSYFSYADLSDDKISLTPFLQTNYITVLETDVDDLIESCEIILEIWGDQVKINNDVLALDSLLSVLENDDACKQEESLQIELRYDAQTSYQDYLRVKTFLMYNEISCSSDEYVYTVK